MSVHPMPGVGLEPLKIEWAQSITFDPADASEIVEDIFVKGAMSVVYGESNSGKTTMLGDLAFRMTRGEPWLGRRVVMGSVIYVAAESPNSLRRRLEAYRRTH